MASTHDNITMWMRRLADGSDLAAEKIWNRYFDDLARLARRRMEPSRRRAADEEDIASSALKSFYRGVREGRYADLSDRHALWNLLFVITVRKVYKRVQREKRHKGESALIRTSQDGNEFGGVEQILGKEPTPELAFQFSQTCEEMLDGLQDEKLRRVAVLKMEGYSNPEIAAQLDCVLRTVERKLERIRKKWAPDGQAA